MAKQNDKTTAPTATDDTIPPATPEDNRAAAGIMLVDADRMTTADMAKLLSGWAGNSAEEWEVVVAGSVPYWNPSEKGGEVLFGRLERRQEIVANVKGKPMNAALYTIKIADPCVAACVTPDGELASMSGGDTVCIIERKILVDLANYIGRDIAIFCDGKGKTRAGQDVWRYRVAARKAPPSVAVQHAG